MQWAEGMIFKGFLEERRILRIDEMPILTRDEYLGGVLDFTGELNRYAIKCATERDIDAVKQCRDTVDTLMGVFLEVRADISQRTCQEFGTSFRHRTPCELQCPTYEDTCVGKYDGQSCSMSMP